MTNNNDIKNLLHHLNDMYKAIGVLQSSANDIKKYIGSNVHAQISKDISDLDEAIESIGFMAHQTYLKRTGKL